jgi:ribosomal protein L37AE/L43A
MHRKCSNPPCNNQISKKADKGAACVKCIYRFGGAACTPKSNVEVVLTFMGSVDSTKASR